MTRNLLLITACLLSAGTYAQSKKFDFKLGQEYDLPRRTEDLAFIGNQKDGIVNLSVKKEELIMVRFDAANLKKTLEQKIDLDATRNFNSEIVADFSNGNYFWIHSDWDKGSGSEILYCDKVDVQKGKLASTNQKMFESSKLAGESAVANGFYSFKMTNKYKFDFDLNKTVLGVMYRLAPESRNDKKNFDRLGFQVFDDNMKKLWGGEFTMPYTEAVMDNSDFTVDSKGNVYMVAKVYDNDRRIERDKATGMPAYHFEILKFSKDNKKFETILLTLNDNYSRETSIKETTNGEIVVASTYSKRAKGNGTAGVFLAKINADNKLEKLNKGFFEFPKEQLAKFESDRTKRRMDKNEEYEALNLQVRDLIVEKDGSVLITCEEYEVRYHYTQNRVIPYYLYNDIVASKINAAGEFEWLRKIPKKQQGTRGRGTMSFKLINDASGYYFLYLDHIKNLDLPEDRAPRMHQDGAGGQVIVTKISNTGDVTKDLLFDTRDEDIMIFPADFYKIDGNRFIGRARIKKKLFQPLLITSK